MPTQMNPDRLLITSAAPVSDATVLKVPHNAWLCVELVGNSSFYPLAHPWLTFEGYKEHLEELQEIRDHRAPPDVGSFPVADRDCRPLRRL